MKIRPINSYEAKTDKVQTDLKELYEILKEISSNNYSTETKDKLYHSLIQPIREILNSENVLGLARDNVYNDIFIIEYPIKYKEYTTYEQLIDEEGIYIEIKNNL